MTTHLQSIPLTAKVRIASAIIVEDIDGEAILLNTTSEQFFGLDDVGTRMFHTLHHAESIQAAYDILLNTYAVEPDVLCQDLLTYVEQLQRDGLIEITMP